MPAAKRGASEEDAVHPRHAELGRRVSGPVLERSRLVELVLMSRFAGRFFAVGKHFGKSHAGEGGLRRFDRNDAMPPVRLVKAARSASASARFGRREDPTESRIADVVASKTGEEPKGEIADVEKRHKNGREATGNEGSAYSPMNGIRRRRGGHCRQRAEADQSDKERRLLEFEAVPDCDKPGRCAESGKQAKKALRQLRDVLGRQAQSSPWTSAWCTLRLPRGGRARRRR